ncbi:hypothetical protein [Christiangramia sp. LLG6405-1]|uniref:hypothetical protein n=1 Tax=Christiangramia sp. LLG6405-1 TaxID=3160832 RepID=UPI003863A42F
MKKISTKTLFIAIFAFALFLTGSYFLLELKNGKTTILIVAIILIAGLNSQIRKDFRIHSEK